MQTFAKKVVQKRETDVILITGFKGMSGYALQKRRHYVKRKRTGR